MSMVVLRAWDQMVEARKQFFSFWVALSLGAVACAFAALLGVEQLRWPTVVLSLLSAHALTIWIAMSKIANQQAAFDMLKATMRTPPAVKRSGFHAKMRAGEIHELTGVSAAKLTVKVRALTDCEIEVIPQ